MNALNGRDGGIMNRKLVTIIAIAILLASVIVYFVLTRKPAPKKIDYTQRAGTESKTPKIELPDIGPYETEESWPVGPLTPVEYSVSDSLKAGQWYIFTGRVLVNKPAPGPYQFRTYTARGIVPPNVESVKEHYTWIESRPGTTEVESDGDHTIREYGYLIRAPKEPGQYSFFVTNMAMGATQEYVFLRATFRVESSDANRSMKKPAP